MRKIVPLIAFIVIFFIFELTSFYIIKYQYRTVNLSYLLPNLHKFTFFTIKGKWTEFTEFNPYYVYRYTKNIKTESSSKTNYKGLIFYPEIKNLKNYSETKKNYKDIFFFGGSTSYDKYKVPLSFHLHNKLKGLDCNWKQDEGDLKKKENKFKLRFIHAGHSGYTSTNQFNRLFADVLFLKPDAVVFFDGVNDFVASHAVPEWTFNDTIHGENAKQVFKRHKNKSISLSDLDLANRFYSTYLFGKIIKKLFGINLIDEKKSKEMKRQLALRIKQAGSNTYVSNAYQNYIQNQLALTALADKFDFKSIHFLQPTLAYDMEYGKTKAKKGYSSFFPDPLNSYDFKDKKIISDFYYNNIVKYYDDINKFYNTNDMSTSNSFFINLSGALFSETNADKNYYDFWHYQPDKSGKIIVELISKEIAKKLCF